MASVNSHNALARHRSGLRLRHLLAVGVCALGATWSLPRARAAWRLHDTAVLYADYGLCMGGPTGAVGLRDQPREFWRLVRRRLVASPPADSVFANCAQLAERLTGTHRVSELHRAKASEFAEWGARNSTLNLEQLERALPDLSLMSQSAWPFLRSSVALLIKPSLGAKEAIHPVQSARPGTVLGLQIHGKIFRARRVTERGWFVVTSDGHDTRAMRSRDRGRKWMPTSPWQSALQGTNERCASDGSERTFGLVSRRAGVGPSVVYFDHESKTGQSFVGGPNSLVVSLACDEIAATIVTKSDGGEFGIWLCAANEPCKALPLPSIFSDLSADGIDVARLRGATVIAISQGLVVRVISTRDDGRSYTPFTVALDHDDNFGAGHAGYLPAQLLSIAGNLIMTQETVTGNAPSVALVSSDFGASWRASTDLASK